MNIAEILKQAGLPEESLTQIQEAFDVQVEAKLGERLELEVKSALTKQEEDHKEILKKVFEAAETKRKDDLAQQERKSVAGLKQLIEKHQKDLTEAAAEFRNQLEEQISDFLDEHLTAVIPNSILEEAARNNNARKILQRVREIASLDETLVKENVRKAILEGKALIDKQAKQLSAAEQRAVIAEAALLLEQKTRSFPQDKKQYFTSMFANRSSKFITENFAHAEKMYARGERRDADTEFEQAKKNSTTKDIDRPITESAPQPGTEDDQTQKVNESTQDPFGYLAALRENW